MIITNYLIAQINKLFKREDEYDLHTKVLSYIKQFYKKYIYKNCLMVATLGENQDTSDGRITS